MPRKRQLVLGARIDAISWDEAIGELLTWAEGCEHRYVCICNAHSVVTATNDAAFKMVVDNADLATADGASVAWALRRFGFSSQERINGPDLMWRYLRKAEQLDHSVYFYGSTDATLARLLNAVAAQFPHLHIAGSYAPSFYAPTEQEDDREVDAINRSGANVVFVGLGCPKQEKWMAAHCGRVDALMIGVGAAFDFHAGTIKRAPLWFQRHGLEWLYRMGSEPRRLFKRYLVTNTLFVIGIARQLLSHVISRKTSGLSKLMTFKSK